MKYLTVNQILVIHSEVIEQVGGSKGTRDMGLLESAVARSQATFSGKNLYPDVFSRAAALGHSLICNHPFVDGNKRTGYMAMRLFLNLNKYDLKASFEERYKFIMEIVQKLKDKESIARWLKNNSRRNSKDTIFNSLMSI